MQALLVVLINPVEGREDDFNNWYTHVHIRDVMRFAGSIRVQRLVESENQVETPSHKYFTLYDTFDPALLSLEHREAMGTRRMVITHAHDQASVINAYYYPVASRTNCPTALTCDEQPLILEMIDVPTEQRDVFEDHYAGSRLPDLLRAPGHMAGALMRFDRAGQMFEFEPAFSHIAVWRVDDLPRALPAWQKESLPPFLNGLRRQVGCYIPQAPYLTRDHVLRASTDELAVEEAMRQRAEQENATTEQLGLKWADER